MFKLYIFSESKYQLKKYTSWFSHEVKSIQSINDIDQLKNYLISSNKNVFLIDVDEGRQDVQHFIAALRKKSDTNKILFISKYQSLSLKLDAFSIGVDNYLDKKQSKNIILAQIKSTIRRIKWDYFTSKKFLKDLGKKTKAISIYIHKNFIVLKGRIIQLSPSELEIFKMLIKYPEKVISKKDIITSTEIKGDLEKSFNIYLYNIRKKFNQKGFSDIITTIPGYGYKLNIEQ